MTEEEIKLLKQQYLCDSNINTTDELVDEAIATLESYFELMNKDDLHKNARLIVLPYLALIAVKKDKSMTWISVKDRLPGCYEVIVCSENGEIGFAYLDDDGKWYGDFDDVIYWMPLPEPPEDGV